MSSASFGSSRFGARRRLCGSAAPPRPVSFGSRRTAVVVVGLGQRRVEGERQLEFLLVLVFGVKTLVRVREQIVRVRSGADSLAVPP